MVGTTSVSISWMPTLLLFGLLSSSLIRGSESVCLKLRADFINHDRGAGTASQSDNRWKGFVQVSGNNVVGLIRNGIFTLDPLRRLGDHFGSDLNHLALAENGQVVATANENGYIAVLHHDEAAGTLTRVRMVTTGTDDADSHLPTSWGGLALNGNGTLLATSMWNHKGETEETQYFVGLFPIDINNVVNYSAPALAPVETVPGVEERTLVLSSEANVLVAADDACRAEYERARMKIFRRSFNETGFSWSKELDVWGHTHRCTRKFGPPGISVATNDDGSVVAIGSFNNDTNTPAVSVYTYDSDKAEWMLRDLIETGNNRTFVSLSGDGTWLAIGTPLWNATVSDGNARVTLMKYDADKVGWETMATVSGTDDNISLGNGIAINKDATILAAGHSNSQLLVYDVLHNDSDCQIGMATTPVPPYPFPDTSSCTLHAVTINSSGPVLRMGLSGDILAFEDTLGLDRQGESTPKFYDLEAWTETLTYATNNDTRFMLSGVYGTTDWTLNNVLPTENLTDAKHQDVLLTAYGTISAILTQGETDEDPSIIRVFRLTNHNMNTSNLKITTPVASSIFQHRNISMGPPTKDASIDDPSEWAEELPNITSTTDLNMGSMALNGDGTVIAVLRAQINERDRPENVTLQNFRLNEDHSEWVQMGSNISVASVFTEYSLSHSGQLLAVGDTQVGENREGRVQIFEFKDNDWELQAEFNGVPDEDKTLGFSTDFNADGTILAVAGALSRDLYGVPAVGAVHVYHNTNDTNGWELRDRFSLGNRNDGFGQALALSDDGRRMAVGSFLPYPERSRVRLFQYDDSIGQWQLLFAELGYSVIVDSVFGYEVSRYAFGASVALNEEGTLMATGSAYGPSGGGSPFGFGRPNHSSRRSWPEFVRVYNLDACLANISFHSNRSMAFADADDTNASEQNIATGTTDPSSPDPSESSVAAARIVVSPLLVTAMAIKLLL